jgi:hypothetical protein
MRCSERKGKRSFNGDKGIKNDACEKRWWRWWKVGVSRARIDQKKDESIRWRCTLFLPTMMLRGHRRSIPFPLIIVTLTTIYEFVEIFIMRRCLFIITEPSDFLFRVIPPWMRDGREFLWNFISTFYFFELLYVSRPFSIYYAPFDSESSFSERQIRYL